MDCFFAIFSFVYRTSNICFNFSWIGFHGFLYATLQVQNCYKVRKDNSLAVKTPTPKQKDVRPRIPQYMGGLMPSGETVEDVARAAAYKVADAENKSFLAAEAVKEAERVAKMAEDTDSMLQMIKDVYEQCK